MCKTITDSFLGSIKYSERFKCYEGEIGDANNKKIEFVLEDLDIEKNLEEALDYSRKIIKDIVHNPIKYKLYAAEELLDLYNDTWTEGEIINCQEFANRITLESIVLYIGDEIDNSAIIYYEDGDLFAGHSIVVCVDSKGQLESAEIAG